MTNVIIPTLPASHVVAWCQQVTNKFAEAFGTPFGVLYQSEQWVTLIPPDVGVSLPSDALELDEVSQSKRAQVKATANEKTVLVVPIQKDGVELAFVGELSVSSAQLAVPLASTILETFEQREKIDALMEQLYAYAFQVTTDFEELTWLRRLAEYMDVCELRNDLAAVATAILPDLCYIIHADAVLLYLSENEDSSHSLACSAGPAAQGVSSALEVIRRLGQYATQRPLVRNSASPNDYIDGLSGVRSCILVRLAKEQRHFGWLVALNKTPVCNPVCEEKRIGAEALSNWEFGTFEAGLLNSAGAMLTSHAHNRESFRQVEQLLGGIIRAMIQSIDAKDTYTFGHSDRVASMSKRIARQMGLTDLEQERIQMAGLLHDIGKIGVPDHVLRKPGRLTDEEFSQIKRHPEIGYSILEHLEQLHYVLPGVLHHHEAFDGRGYPHGLAGEQIPLIARILAVADAFDAMTSNRPYRFAMPMEKAESILRSGAGKQWDGQVVEAFFQCLEEIHQICFRCDPEMAIASDGRPTSCCSPIGGSDITLAIRSARACGLVSQEDEGKRPNPSRRIAGVEAIQG